jgi:hypothetical protein
VVMVSSSHWGLVEVKRVSAIKLERGEREGKGRRRVGGEDVLLISDASGRVVASCGARYRELREDEEERANAKHFVTL